jgi:hypothetical protein
MLSILVMTVRLQQKVAAAAAAVAVFPSQITEVASNSNCFFAAAEHSNFYKKSVPTIKKICVLVRNPYIRFKLSNFEIN